MLPLFGDEIMKKNYLKIIVTLTAVIPCLSACDTYQEGKKVEAECIYNGYEEAPDFNKSLTINTKDYEGLVANGNGDCFSIDSFKIYDSLYLADINGDGHRDFCTDFLYYDRNHYYHGYAFYDMKKKSYIEYFLPNDGMSYYLGEKDGYLVIKEFSGEHDPTTYKENKGHRRTATLLTSKDKPELVWKDDDFDLHSYYLGFHNLDNGWWIIEDKETKEERYICATERTDELFLIYDFDGALTQDSYYANDCLIYDKNDAYEIVFDKEKSENSDIDLSAGRCEIWYKVTFKKEGDYDIKVSVSGIEDVLKVRVDNTLYYKK